jgi:signal transduction histidine kinase
MPEAAEHASAPSHVVAFERLPVAALLRRGDRIVAVNPAYERFMSAPAESVVGRTVDDLIGQFVGVADVPLAGAAAQARLAGTSTTGHLWLRVTDTAGRTRAIRVDWQPSGTPDESVIYLTDAEGEATAKAAAEGLARAAGELGRCRDEREILERAADVLHARGFIVTTLLLREGDPLLEYGPMRRPASPSSPAGSKTEAARALRATRPRREILWELNKDFHQRRAWFFQDVEPLVMAAYPGPTGEAVRAALTSRRTVQAPLFVNDVAYGALVLTGDELTPALAGSIEMFAELVARAIENLRLRTELVQRERLAALGEAAAVMAHEVRNPIGAILNAAALMEKETTGAAAKGDLLRVIGEEAMRLDRLVGDLLDLGRPLTPRLRSVDLHELASRSVAVLASRGEAGAAEVVILPSPAVVTAEIDPDLTQLALWNVVRNAVQASPPGKRVTVSVDARGERAALLVDDEGAGFPAEHVERVLEPFHTTRATGTGIGLAVVRRVVEACRGSIEIGESPGGGGRFVMVFPVS